jgi:hypothetical protein
LDRIANSLDDLQRCLLSEETEMQDRSVREHVQSDCVAAAGGFDLKISVSFSSNKDARRCKVALAICHADASSKNRNKTDPRSDELSFERGDGRLQLM